MKPGELRDLNVIGALALALADDLTGAMEDLAEGNESACAALIVIGSRGLTSYKNESTKRSVPNEARIPPSSPGTIGSKA